MAPQTDVFKDPYSTERNAKRYKALITTAGGAVSAVTVLQNDFGQAIQWVVQGAGQIFGTCSSNIFRDGGYVACMISGIADESGATNRTAKLEKRSANSLGIYTVQDGALTDNLLDSTLVEVSYYEGQNPTV